MGEVRLISPNGSCHLIHSASLTNAEFMQFIGRHERSIVSSAFAPKKVDILQRNMKKVKRSMQDWNTFSHIQFMTLLDSS